MARQRLRWSEPGASRAAIAALCSVLIEKRDASAIDARGVSIGFDETPPELYTADFQEVRVQSLDASAAKLSCAFSRAQIVRSCFDAALFDACRFKASVFQETTFLNAQFVNPYLDDSRFVACDLGGAIFRGKRSREYGGRRMLFENCVFVGVRFENLQMRACTFRKCRFDRTIFQRCILAGTKFEGSTPDSNSFVDCER